MKNTLINISGKITEAQVALYEAINTIASTSKLPYLVVGASARDLVMHYGFGAPIQRATADADFGVEVPSWKTFHTFKDALVKLGFSETERSHRLESPQKIPVDIVPFGGLADENDVISWPPDNSFKMEILGFQEACNHALNVQIRDKPSLNIRVSTPAGLALMKVIAWKDRDTQSRKKDAVDLNYLLENYEKIPEISTFLYQEQRLANRYGWDMALAGAEKLGADTKQIAFKQTSAVINHVLTIKFEQLLADTGNMSGRAEQLLKAFKAGFTS